MFDGLDEVEAAKLEEVIGAVQRFIGAGGVGSSSTSILVADAEKRIESLESTGIFGLGDRERKEEKKSQELVVGYLVQSEAALTSAEKQQYGSFLEHAFFTRGDFEELNEFYDSTYDRLSERGQSEMSHRVWEGCRQGEYQFSELPENVREKEMDRLVGLLSEPEKMHENLQRIPENDREEFLLAMNDGKKDDAAQILNRESFKENVSTAEELAAVSKSTPETEKVEEVQSQTDQKQGEHPPALVGTSGAELTIR